MHSRRFFRFLLLSLICVLIVSVRPAQAQTISPSEERIPSFTCYRNMASAFAKLDALEAAYPALSQKRSLGKSVLGREIYAFEIGKKVHLDKPHLILLTGLHGNDFSQVELALQFAERLLEGYKSDAEMRWIVDNVEVDLILIANPDGRVMAEAEAAGNMIGDTEVSTIDNANGFDLEQNFCTEHPFETGKCQDFPDYQPETLVVKAYLTEKLGTPYLGGEPQQGSENLFIYFSSHKELPPNQLPALAVGTIRIPWFYKANPVPLPEGGLQWQKKLADLMAVRDPNLSGSLLPVTSGATRLQYPVDHVFRAYGVGSLDLSAYPRLDNQPVDCDRFNSYNHEHYLSLLVKAAKAAATPFRVAYGPLVTGLAQTGFKEPALGFRAEALESNDQVEFSSPNPIATAKYLVDQPLNIRNGAVAAWARFDGNPLRYEAKFTLPSLGLSPSGHLLSVQACNEEGFCGLPHSSFISVQKLDLPDPIVEPGKTLYMPFIRR